MRWSDVRFFFEPAHLKPKMSGHRQGFDTHANDVLLWLLISAVSRESNSDVCGIVYWGGGARTASERMCTVARGYTTIFLQKQIVEKFLSSTIKNRHIAHPYEWDIRFVVLKLDAFFPPLGILAEHALQIAMSSSATEKNRPAKTCSQMMT